MPKTNTYDVFKFRTDNRPVNKKHVQDLVNSIKSHNLLELQPITINGDMEILDGQHRLLAAKQLGVDIYYQIEKKLTSADIITMNISKSWGAADYVNYYVKNGHLEYQRLESFMKEHGISLRVAMHLLLGASLDKKAEFRLGKFKFPEGDFTNALEMCWETVGIIKRLNGHSSYSTSARFWQCMVKLANHPEFDKKKWIFNLERLITRMGPRARMTDYLRLFMDIYNYKNHTKIDLLAEEKMEEVA